MQLRRWIFPVLSGCWSPSAWTLGLVYQRIWDGNTGIVVFVDRLTEMDRLAAVPDSIDDEGTALLFIDGVLRQHGLPLTILSDRKPRSTGNFRSPSLRCWAPDSIYLQRIIRRPMVRLSALIASS